MALISGVPEPKIMEVKRKEITEPIRESIARRGNRPRLFSRIVTVAVEALEFLIASVLFKKSREVQNRQSKRKLNTQSMLLKIAWQQSRQQKKKRQNRNNLK